MGNIIHWENNFVLGKVKNLHMLCKKSHTHTHLYTYINPKNTVAQGHLEICTTMSI